MTLNICDPAAASLPTVWYTYLAKEQIFLPMGGDPGTWANPTFPLPTKGNPPLRLFGGLYSKATVASILDEFDEAAIDRPLVDVYMDDFDPLGRTPYVLFEIRVNQSEFTYLSQSTYYDATCQMQAFTLGGMFRPFPKTGQPTDFNPPVELPEWAQQGALEVKASWRQLVPGVDHFNRYYTREVYVELPGDSPGQTTVPVTLGLVGLHILRLTPSTGKTWFWATFEQVDNVEITDLTPPVPDTPSFNPGPGPNGPPYTTHPGYECEGWPANACPPPEVLFNMPLPAPHVVRVSRIPQMALPPNVETINSLYQGMLTDSPWRYYKLINTLQPGLEVPVACSIDLPDGTANPTNTVNRCFMTNTTMETYTQDLTKGSDFIRSCTDCHAKAVPQGAPKDTTDFQVFTFLLGDATPSGDVDICAVKAAVPAVSGEGLIVLPLLILGVGMILWWRMKKERSKTA